MITKQIEAIKKRVEENDETDYTEVAIWLIDNETSVNFIIDLVNHFKYEVNDGWLYVEYDGGSTDDTVIYSHLVKIDQIAYITDEV